MTIALYCTIFGLITIIFVQAISHRLERKDLYDRIMCRDMSEYKNKDKPKESPKSAHKRVIERWRKKNDDQIQG